ncbi:MAG: hypothetical protein R3351_08170, partial [Nitrospirales bacterium]|nr:hypothetical protein [Nitrospirales bacterium]
MIQPGEGTMKQKLSSRAFFRVLLCIGFSLFFVSGVIRGSVAYGENATVLPKGAWQIANETWIFLPIDSRYDNDGNVVSLGAPLSRNLTPLFPPLPPNPFLMQPANVGSSLVNISLDQTEIYFTPAYGITDRLSVGAFIRWIEQDTNISAAIDSSQANTGTSPLLISAMNPLGLGAPCFTVGCETGGPLPGTEPLTIEDLQNAITAAGFQPLTNWSESGFGDTDVGGRYQYYRAENMRSAVTAGVQLPTGKEDDPDNLLDRRFGTETWGLIFQHQNDVLFDFGLTPAAGAGLAKRLGFPSPGSGFLTTDFHYNLFFPQDITLRVCPPSAPICATKANVTRDLGDQIEAQFRLTYGLIKGFILRPQFDFRYQFKTNISGTPSGVNGDLLEIDTIRE